MRILVFGDVHLDTPFTWATPAYARRRRQSLREVMRALVDIAHEQRVNAVLCAGDLYEHDRVAPDTGGFLAKAFADLHPCPVLIAPGNHDWLGPASLYAHVDWSPNVHVFTDDHLVPYSLDDDVVVWGSAHRAPANTDGFFEAGPIERTNRDHGSRRDGRMHFALFHGSERSGLVHQGQGKLPHAPFSGTDIERHGFKHAFVGHFHVPRDDEWYTYPGNPEPLAFGESDRELDRGFVLVEMGSNGELTRTRHRVARTVLQDVTIDITGATSRDEARFWVADALRPRTGTVRLRLTGTVSPSVDIRRSDLDDVAPWLDALVTRPVEVTADYDFEVLARSDTVRGAFVREVLASDLPSDERRRVMVVGLRALEGRDDLEVD